MEEYGERDGEHRSVRPRLRKQVEIFVRIEQANELMQREMLEEQLEAQAAKTAEVRGRLDATLSELCAVATPSDLRMMRILKARPPTCSTSSGLANQEIYETACNLHT